MSYAEVWRGDGLPIDENYGFHRYNTWEEAVSIATEMWHMSEHRIEYDIYEFNDKGEMIRRTTPDMEDAYGEST